MNILITGGTGFVGSHMIDYILKYAIRLDQKIYCTKRWMEDTKNLNHVRRKDRLEFIDCDLLDAHSIRRANDDRANSLPLRAPSCENIRVMIIFIPNAL